MTALENLANDDAVEYLFTELIDAPETPAAVERVLDALPTAEPRLRAELIAWLAEVGASKSAPEQADRVLEVLTRVDTPALAAYGAALEHWGRLGSVRAHREQVTARLQESLESAEGCEDRAALISALGFWGADVSDHLGEPELAVAAAAARHNRSNTGTETLLDVLADPDTEEAWAAVDGSYCITNLVDELLRRGLSFAEMESVAVAYASDEYLPWQMFLPVGAGQWDSPAGRNFLHALVHNNAIWEDDAADDTAAALREAGLPSGRCELKAMVG